MVKAEGVHILNMPQNYGQLPPVLHVVPLQLLTSQVARMLPRQNIEIGRAYRVSLQFVRYLPLAAVTFSKMVHGQTSYLTEHLVSRTAAPPESKNYVGSSCPEPSTGVR